MNIKSKNLSLFTVVISLLLLSSIVSAEQQPIRVLIYSGANNHKWSETTPVIKDILDKAAIIADVTDNPADVTAKLLLKYNVIVSNWNNFKDKSLVWPKETRKAYLDFISNGGGHVMLHAGGSSFYDWPEYHNIVASWGKKTGHGPKHEFPVNIEVPDHPICAGLKNFKTTDELWRNTKLPDSSVVLMSGFSSKKSGGKDNKEPILAVSNYGKGRCVNFMLGHDAATMTNPDFKTILAGSVRWAAQNKQSRYFFSIKTEENLAVINNGKTLWQFNFGKKTSKPFFHPLALLDGTVLTEDRPADHPWHHGLWFTWKFINGVNFWEENRKTGKSNGKTDWSNLSVNSKDGIENISLDLTYNIRGQEPILSEKRLMTISAPDKEGVYYIDWTSKFTACSDIDVKLDRTPIPGEKNGKAWGGFAGISVRLNGKGDNWAVTTEKETITFENGTYRGKAESMDFSGVFNGRPAGIAILDHPENLNSPTPWYAIAGKSMKYFSPAVICNKPHTIKPGKTLELKYRVIVHPKKWNAENLKSQLKKYKASLKQLK
jgi:type 1 glutamine amidotransferase